MGLLDKLKQSADDYIYFLDFITGLSSGEQETIKDLSYYLLQINLHDRIKTYRLSEPYTYTAYDDNANLEKGLTKLQNSHNFNFIFTANLTNAILDIEQLFYQCHIKTVFLNKSELLVIDELNNHLDFLQTGSITDSTGEVQNQPTPQDETAQLKQKLQAKDNEITRLQALIVELESTQNAGVNDKALHPRTANNSHTNTALQALNEVIATHWQDPNNPPKQQFIIAWIIDNYPNIDPSKALWIDKIIRHKDK